MAAGLGFKTFTTGEVLTAADVNGYLMQGVLVFASEAARNSAITSPQEGQFAYTKDNNSLWYYTGSAWAASGATGDIEGVTAGVGISGGGTSGTVTITNSMATEIDAKGDLVVGTGADTFARLPVGTNGYTLVADSSVSPTGLKWAAPSSGLTLIKTATFSNVADTGTTFDDVFSSSYDNYVVVINQLYGATSASDPQFQFRYAGPTTQVGTYRWNYAENNGTSFGFGNGTAPQNEVTLGSAIGGSAGYGCSYTITLYNVRSTGSRPYVFSQAFTEGEFSLTAGAYQYTSRTYTGILFKSSSGNIYGTVSIYGLAK